MRTSTPLNLQILKWNGFSDLNASLAKKKKKTPRSEACRNPTFIFISLKFAN